jgi:N6-L-threonylcarbamoyladenine synthase
VPPFPSPLVSGGHTLLIDVEAWGRYRLLGRTRDDAAGEAFDKVAKLLGLPYPGGPHVERMAAAVRRGDNGGPRFARPMLRRDQRPEDSEYYDVSFSGLKTAVLNAVKSAPPDADRAPIARAFQDAVIDTLVEKTARAAHAYGRRRVVLGGGVACNQALVAAMRERFRRDGVDVFAPTPRLATDNAAMIACAGLFHLERGERSGLDLNAFAASPIPGLVAA